MYLAYQSGQFASLSPVRFSCSPCAASARRSALARSLAELNVVAAESIRPGSRVVISWSSQRLPSGSSNEANEKYRTTFRVTPRDARVLHSVIKWAAGVVEHLAHVDAAAYQVIADGVEVIHGED